MAASSQRQLYFLVKKKASVNSKLGKGHLSGQGKLQELGSGEENGGVRRNLAMAAKEHPGREPSPDCQQENKGCPLSPGRERPLQTPPLSPIKLSQVSNSPRPHSTDVASPCKRALCLSGQDPLWSPAKSPVAAKKVTDMASPCKRTLSLSGQDPLRSPAKSSVVAKKVTYMASPCKQTLGLSGQDPLRSPAKSPMEAKKALILKGRFFSKKTQDDQLGKADVKNASRAGAAAKTPPRVRRGDGHLDCSSLVSPPPTPHLRTPTKRPFPAARGQSPATPGGLASVEAADHSPQKVSRLAAKNKDCDVVRTPSKMSASLLENTPRKTPGRSKEGERDSAGLTPRKTLTPQRGEQGVRNSRTPQKSARRLHMSPVSSPRRTPRKTQAPDPESSASRTEIDGDCKTKSQRPGLSSKKDTPLTESRHSKVAAIRQKGRLFQAAKQSLHTAKPSHLVGRDAEVKIIRDFLEERVKSALPGSMYISGAPGTGKTAALMHVLDSLKEQHRCHLSYLNCMALRDAASVFVQLLQSLSSNARLPRTDPQRQLEKLITSSKLPIVVVLDEVDQLDSRQQEVLYTLFEWPSLPHSSLILIGIANALDLTDRVLPRLQARPKCQPQLLNFPPYSRQQITDIIQDRLSQVAEEGRVVMEPAAVQFCARKISAIAGDARKALDVCRRAVEHAEKNGTSLSSSALHGVRSPQKTRPPTLVTVADVGAVLSEVYGSSVEAAEHGDSTVPLQQKLLVCSLLLLLQHGRSKVITMGQLHDIYCKVCKRRKVSAVDQSEFFNLCSLLEARSIVGLRKAKEPRLTKVSLKLDEQELHTALKDRVLISSILADGLPK